jgi:hypothetical protein
MEWALRTKDIDFISSGAVQLPKVIEVALDHLRAP